MAVDHYGHPMTLKWDPKNLEIRTMSVEKTLEPLVVQVGFHSTTTNKFWACRKRCRLTMKFVNCCWLMFLYR
jgi:hypothetical protein